MVVTRALERAKAKAKAAEVVLASIAVRWGTGRPTAQAAAASKVVSRATPKEGRARERHLLAANGKQEIVPSAITAVSATTKVSCQESELEDCVRLVEIAFLV
mmetsp:Transcript_82934/g.146538  ORF Transcript_82934/g.146538 Transcript_82934/m.146538 type:complete len:103 (-) Transcript_82934:208-516(-)